jgi:hypothetical protein
MVTNYALKVYISSTHQEAPPYSSTRTVDDYDVLSHFSKAADVVDPPEILVAWHRGGGGGEIVHTFGKPTHK